MKKPLSQLPDKTVREIRGWRGLCRQLAIYRAKGYCEHCGKFWGPELLRGHHRVRPTMYKGNPNAPENTILVCPRCSRSGEWMAIQLHIPRSKKVKWWIKRKIKCLISG